MSRATINLDENFSPFGGYNPNFWQFPSKCEIGVKVDEIPIKDNDVRIVARLNSSDKIVKLLMLTDAVKRQKAASISLFLSYLPYARQDRIMVNGESFSLKVIAELINSQQYSKVQVFNPHSNASSLLINNFEEITDHKFVELALSSFSNYLLISPDFGASKKIYELAKYLKYQKEIVQANKIRDLNTGKIIKYDLPESSVVGAHCVIVDDICSKGGTFILLAEKLKRMWAKSVTLIVSHYEDSADKNQLLKFIDKVIVTNSFTDIDVTNNDSFEVIELSGIIL